MLPPSRLRKKSYTTPRWSSPSRQDYNSSSPQQPRTILSSSWSIRHRSYPELKHKGIEYKVGDFIQLYDVTLKKPYVARLSKIVQVRPALEKLPFVEVEWCLRKGDLPEKIMKLYGKHISEAEIFPSSIKICLYIESIKGKASILTIDEYSEMPAAFEHIYFSRSCFMNETGELAPSPFEWNRSC